LRETAVRPTSPELGFGVTDPAIPARHEPSLFASSIEEPRPRSGVSIWLAAAAALVIGIGIGFASGYRAGKGSTSVAAAATENPAATSGATGGQPFSESAVQDPVKLNPEPIVPAPATVPAGPPRRPQPAAAPAPQKQPTEGRPAKAPTAVGRVPPRIQAVAADPPEPTVTGPASLQVESRPSGAQVILDGRSIGKTPMTVPDVATGFHDIRLELSGFKVWSTTVGVKAGIATRVAASLEQ
jgi:eukaryotic-like serine/threonine-protein kinase